MEWRKILKPLSELSFAIAFGLLLISFIFGIIGLAVPDWLYFQENFLTEVKLGLWNFCTHSITTSSSGFNCNTWSKQNVAIPGRHYFK